MDSEETVIQPPAQQRRSKIMPTFLLMLLLGIAATGAMYYWQHRKVTSLTNDISRLRSDLMVAKDTTGTFTYASKAGGLKLTLPKSLGLIINADGKKGSITGATLRVAKVRDNRILFDYPLRWVQIDIDDSAFGLNDEASITKSIMQKRYHDANQRISTTTVANLPAMLITADNEDVFVGKTETYVVVSGDFTYRIRASGMQFDDLHPMLAAVFKGIHIEPKKAPR